MYPFPRTVSQKHLFDAAVWEFCMDGADISVTHRDAQEVPGEESILSGRKSPGTQSNPETSPLSTEG